MFFETAQFIMYILPYGEKVIVFAKEQYMSKKVNKRIESAEKFLFQGRVNNAKRIFKTMAIQLRACNCNSNYLRALLMYGTAFYYYLNDDINNAKVHLHELELIPTEMLNKKDLLKIQEKGTKFLNSIIQKENKDK